MPWWSGDKENGYPFRVSLSIVLLFNGVLLWSGLLYNLKENKLKL